MAQLLGSLAKSYLQGKIGSIAAEKGWMGNQGTSSIGTTLGNLAAGSSGNTLSPPQFDMPTGNIRYVNRERQQPRRRRMF